jgi:hypothetical protein
MECRRVGIRGFFQVFVGNLSVEQPDIFGTLKKIRLYFSVNKTVFYITVE